ncbi:hypothetical protein A2U01_0057830, partial [Trifolium medium]|nr:hypothetical protein [Trifolium medium]
MAVIEQDKAMERERANKATGQGGDEEIIESQPLSHTLWDTQVPEGFKIPHLPTFDGKTDPLEHLMVVGIQIAIIGASEHLKCKLLSGTFKDVALR